MGLVVEIDPTPSAFGRLTVSMGGKQMVFVVTREELERLSRQLPEQLTKAPLPPDRRGRDSPASDQNK